MLPDFPRCLGALGVVLAIARSESLETYGVDAQTMTRVVKPLIGASSSAATFNGPTRTGRRRALEAFASMVESGGWDGVASPGPGRAAVLGAVQNARRPEWALKRSASAAADAFDRLFGGGMLAAIRGDGDAAAFKQALEKRFAWIRSLGPQ